MVFAGVLFAAVLAAEEPFAEAGAFCDRDAGAFRIDTGLAPGATLDSLVAAAEVNDAANKRGG